MLNSILSIEIQTNISDTQQMLETMQANVERATEAAVKEVALQVLLATTRAMERDIYDKPLPASMARRGIERTGALLAGESMIEEDPLNFLITTTDTGMTDAKGRPKMPTEYAHWRHEYQGLPAPWRTHGLEEIEPELQAIADEAFFRELGVKL